MSFEYEKFAQDVIHDDKDHGIHELYYEQIGDVVAKKREHHRVFGNSHDVFAKHDKERERAELKDEESSYSGGRKGKEFNQRVSVRSEDKEPVRDECADHGQKPGDRLVQEKIEVEIPLDESDVLFCLDEVIEYRKTQKINDSRKTAADEIHYDFAALLLLGRKIVPALDYLDKFHVIPFLVSDLLFPYGIS